ncbi:MAG: isochorismatase family protein [Actinomycetota bacterium]|nr:isochorismatase family protein [Actinomycetota bacterium]
MQDKLAAAMSKKQKVVDNTLHLIKLAKLLQIPIIVTEQYPKGLGPTVSETREALESHSPLEKVVFNCCKALSFLERLEQTGRRQIILTGMEIHICVLQTAVGLMQTSYKDGKQKIKLSKIEP